MTCESSELVTCRKGATCSFPLTVTGGFGTQYTEAELQVRDSADEGSVEYFRVDQDTGITIVSAAAGTITVSIGATVTAAIGLVLTKPRRVFAIMSLIDPTDADDVFAFEVPFQFQPGAAP